MLSAGSTSKFQEDETYYTGSNVSYSEESENEYHLDVVKSNKRIEYKIERKPTRVPNLKIQNRNALLARENRKRKKEMMENLEKDVNILHDKNRRLHKIIKTQDSQMKKLNKEIYYLKSVLKNQTEIVKILKSLSYASSNMNCVMDKSRVLLDSSKSSSETLSCNTSDDDFEAENIGTEWDEILKNPLNSANDFSDIPVLSNNQTAGSPFSETSTDHNYFQPTIPGICLHINTGKVSLEYCSICHHNAKNSCENSD